MMSLNYGAIITCRNEEQYIESALTSILNQTIKPSLFLIIDDNSTDRTREIISNYPEVTLIHAKRPRYKVRGVNIAMSLNQGMGLMYKLNPDFEMLLTIDSDCSIPPNYVERLSFQLQRQRKLGIVSGTSIPKLRLSKEHVTNGARLYKRGAVDVIFPFQNETGFDTWILYKARACGYRLMEYRIKYRDARPYNRKTWYRWFLSGRSRYLHGFPLIWNLYCMPRYSTLEPAVTGYMVMLLSYILHHLTGWRLNEHPRTRLWVNSNLTRAYIKVFRRLIRKGLVKGIKYILRVMSK